MHFLEVSGLKRRAKFYLQNVLSFVGIKNLTQYIASAAWSRLMMSAAFMWSNFMLPSTTTYLIKNNRLTLKKNKWSKSDHNMRHRSHTFKQYFISTNWIDS